MSRNDSWIVDVLASAGTSLIVGALVAILVVWAFFSNTRADGLAVVIITFLSAGLFTNAAMLGVLRRKSGKPLQVWLIAAIPWLALASIETLGEAHSDFISWNNWRWILANASTDSRSYQLVWIIRGWSAVLGAAGLGLLTARALVRPGAHVKELNTEARDIKNPV